jgi:malate dehydrogenase
VSTPVKVAVTGAAGQICYSLRSDRAVDAGPDQPVELRLLGSRRR